MKPNPRLLGKKLLETDLNLDQILTLKLSEQDRKAIWKVWGDHNEPDILKSPEKLLAEGDISGAINRYEFLEIDYTKPEIKSKILDAAEKLSKEKPFDEDLFEVFCLFNQNKYYNLLESAINANRLSDKDLVQIFFNKYELIKNHSVFKDAAKKIINYCVEHTYFYSLSRALDKNLPSVTKELVLNAVKNNLNSLKPDTSVIIVLENLGVPAEELSSIGDRCLEICKKEHDLNYYDIALVAYMQAKDTNGLIQHIDYSKKLIAKEKAPEVRDYLIIHTISAMRYYEELIGDWSQIDEVTKLIELYRNESPIVPLRNIKDSSELLRLKQKFDSENKLFLAELAQKRLEELNKNENKS